MIDCQDVAVYLYQPLLDIIAEYIIDNYAVVPYSIWEKNLPMLKWNQRIKKFDRSRYLKCLTDDMNSFELACCYGALDIAQWMAETFVFT
jgi:hypothetical protein